MKSITRIRARYAETDVMGIIHHSVYPVWFEEARGEFIKKFGMSYAEMENLGLMMPLRSLQCDYIIPCEYDDELIIKSSISKLTLTRINIKYELYKGDVLCSKGETFHVFTNTDLRPVNVKKAFPEIYKFFQKYI